MSFQLAVGLLMCLLIAFIVYEIWRFSKHHLSEFYGVGENLVVMVHGMGGNPKEFQNLHPMFDLEKYSVAIPYCPQTLRGGLDFTVKSFYRELIEKYGQEGLRSFKTVSFVGNSMGGLVSKRLALLLHTSNPDVVLAKFITVVTPHHGIGHDNTLLNQIRKIYASIFLGQTGKDLLNISQSLHPDIESVLSKFTLRANYLCSTFDLNVPYSSSSMGCKVNIDPEGKDIQKTTIIVQGSKCSNMWDFYAVPIYSLKNHGNVIGKHRDSMFTLYKELVDKSIRHIYSHFSYTEVILSEEINVIESQSL